LVTEHNNLLALLYELLCERDNDVLGTRFLASLANGTRR